MLTPQIILKSGIHFRLNKLKKSDLNVEISLLLDTKMCDPTLLMLQQPLATVSPVFCFGNYDILEIIFF